MSSPSEWGYYHHQHSLTLPQTSDSTTIHANSSAGTTQLSPEGRVTKPARRRSRASRRTPTTLLNTDTTNFRAMVQQFTGGPTAPFGHHHHSPAPPPTFSIGQLGLGIGGGGGAARLQSHPMPPPAAYRLQYNQNQQPWMISLSNNEGGDQEGANMSGDHGFVMGNVSSSSSSPHLIPGPATTNQNRGSSFMF